jgi:hypothetical protein
MEMLPRTRYATGRLRPVLRLGTFAASSKEGSKVLITLRSYVSFANVIALVALFVALSGTSYAVSKVGAKDIRKNAVRAKHIKKNQVAGKHVRNRSITSADLAPGVIGSTLQSSAGQARRDAGPADVSASVNYTTVATLAGLEPGSYVLLAKTNQSASEFTEGRCRLSAGDDYDDSNRGLRPQGTPEAHSLQLVHAFPSGGSVVLACRTPKGTWSTADSKIIAIKVAGASSNVVSG